MSQKSLSILKVLLVNVLMLVIVGFVEVSFVARAPYESCCCADTDLHQTGNIRRQTFDSTAVKLLAKLAALDGAAGAASIP